MKRKGLGHNLKPLLSEPPTDRRIDLEGAARRVGQELRRTGKRVVSVVRMKGGSGETHAVKSILEHFREAGDRVIVVFNASCEKYEEYEEYLEAPTVVASQLAHSVHDVALMKLSWFSLHTCEEEAAALIDSPFDVVIFTCGTDSAPGFGGWEPVRLISQMTLFSVNADQNIQLEMSEQMTTAIEQLGEDGRWYGLWCWSQRLERGEAIHQYSLLKTGDYLELFKKNGVDLEIEAAQDEPLDCLLNRLQCQQGISQSSGP